MKKLIVSAALALAAVASSPAISIDSKRLLGFFDDTAPASPMNDLAYLNVLLDHYNGEIASLPSIYQLAVGVDVPVPVIAKPKSYANGGDGEIGAAVPIIVDDYDWLSLRTGDKTGFYYVGDLSGSHTLLDGLLAGGGAASDTDQKLQENEILIGAAELAKQKAEEEQWKLDLEKLLLEAEKKKVEEKQWKLDLERLLLEAQKQKLEEEKAKLNPSELEKLKEKDKQLKDKDNLLKQKELEKQKLHQEKLLLEAEKQKLELAKLKQEQEKLKQEQAKLTLQKEKERLKKLKQYQQDQGEEGVAVHYNFFGPNTNSAGVPESGATITLLAFTLAAFGWIRRRK